MATKKTTAGPKKTATKTASKTATKKAPAKKAAASKAKPKTAKPKAPAKSRALTARDIKEMSPPKAGKEAPGKRIALAIAEAGLEKKAVNVQIIDVVGKVDYADYLVVMSGRSDRQVSALAKGIAQDVEEGTGQRCMGVEGLPQGSWVLMDFSDVVVHIFHDDVRGYYDLESLWIDAARVPVPGVTKENER
jgi:ribosome-associated protein